MLREDLTLIAWAEQLTVFAESANSNSTQFMVLPVLNFNTAEHSSERQYHSLESQGGKEKSELNKLLSSSMLMVGSTIV